MLKLHWIPDQVRNDKTAPSAIWAIAHRLLLGNDKQASCYAGYKRFRNYLQDAILQAGYYF